MGKRPASRWQATGKSRSGWGGTRLRQGDLLGELKAAEAKYLLYVNKREEARIEDALDQGGILNVDHCRGTASAGTPGPGGLGFRPDWRDCSEAR